MANIHIIKPTNSIVSGWIATGTFSGTVKDENGNFVERRLLLLDVTRLNIADSTSSDATTGEFTLVGTGIGTNNRCSVIALGEGDEYDSILGSLTGVIS